LESDEKIREDIKRLEGLLRRKRGLRSGRGSIDELTEGEEERRRRRELNTYGVELSEELRRKLLHDSLSDSRLGSDLRSYGLESCGRARKQRTGRGGQRPRTFCELTRPISLRDRYAERLTERGDVPERLLLSVPTTGEDDESVDDFGQLRLPQTRSES